MRLEYATGAGVLHQAYCEVPLPNGQGDAVAGCRAGAKPHGQADSRGPSAANNRAYANPVSEADCSVPQASRLPVQAGCLRYGFAFLAAYFKGRSTSCNRAPDFACAS